MQNVVEFSCQQLMLMVTYQAINNLKASAGKKNVCDNRKSETVKEIPKQQGDDSLTFKDDKPNMSSDVQKSRPSSVLPADFFDQGNAKRQKDCKFLCCAESLSLLNWLYLLPDHVYV